MPTYSYACRACGHRFDAIQSIHDDALTACPECTSEVRRVISPAGVTFKGSGFYRTDSRQSSRPGTPSTSEPKSKPKPEKAPATSAAADPA